MPCQITIAALACAGAIASLAACESARERPIGDGAHPSGFAVPMSGNFHGDDLRARGYPLAECRACHGEDLAGGDTQISCSDGPGCHDRGVDACGTCHGEGTSALPVTSGHPAHAVVECASCHPIPATGVLDVGVHINGVADLAFSGLANANGFNVAWNPGDRSCANTYCHLGDSPAWDDRRELGCDGCHLHSSSHQRFARVVSEDTCAGCHLGSPDVGHVDGSLDLAIEGCDGCHGAGPRGAPPPALDGSSDPSDQAVGAHRRHLDPLIAGRIGKVVACARCHAVPTEVTAEGHLDNSSPADVDVILGNYDPASGTCVASCHFDRQPGPRWSDSTGAERACDACHGFPPIDTRVGTRHPPSAPSLAVCRSCHTYEVDRHVNGVVDFL